MENFIIWLYNSFYNFIMALTENTLYMINNIHESFFEGNSSLMNLEFNLVLFSETPILTTTTYDFLLLVFAMFYTIMFVVIWYKIIKKVVVKITRWNKW